MIIPQSIFLVIIATMGMYGAALYGRKTQDFRWLEYILLLSFPVAASLGFVFIAGIKILYLFIISSFVGFGLEYFLGRIYHKTLNKHLWFYSRYSLGGYTSYLTLPMWGVAGIIFWLLSQSIGL